MTSIQVKRKSFDTNSKYCYNELNSVVFSI
jgi:hypothetical protein